jgi:membrane protein DedA with SNARE-associated domain
MDPLGQLIHWSAEYGLLGVFLVVFSERVVPIFPSYAIMAAVGIGAESGAWSPAAALVVAIAGSYVGGSIYYFCAASVSEERSFRFLTRFALLFGTSSDKVEKMIVYFRTNQAALSFTAQLVPTVRLVAPAIAGLLKVKLGPFAAAAALGVAVWNSLFFLIGYACARFSFDGNVSELALELLIVLMVVESLAFVVWRRWRRKKMPVSG